MVRGCRDCLDMRILKVNDWIEEMFIFDGMATRKERTGLPLIRGSEVKGGTIGSELALDNTTEV